MNAPYPSSTSAPRQPIPNYMVWSIIGTIASVVVCCLSCISIVGLGTGIAAIVFSNKVNNLLAQGDVAGAALASKNAKMWNWITTGFIIAGLLLWILMLVTGFGSEYAQQFRDAMEQAAQQSR